MSLIPGQEIKAIYDYQGFGPVFGGGGGGNDIRISDKCNQNNSFSYFPYSYNCEAKYQRNQVSYSVFSGAQSGANFKVLEYEVFQVLK
jgi:hypothetical protein